MIGDGVQVDRPAARAYISLKQRGHVTHVLDGMAAAKTGKVVHRIADVANLDVEYGSDLRSFAQALTAIACDEAPFGSIRHRSEEHTSELQSLMRISYAVFCLKKKNNTPHHNNQRTNDNSRYTHQ